MFLVVLNSLSVTILVFIMNSIDPTYSVENYLQNETSLDYNYNFIKNDTKYNYTETLMILESIDINSNNNMNNNVEKLTFKKEFYKNLSKKMILIMSPILLLLGGIGNPLCIIILTRKKGPNPTVAYLCIMAAFDFLVLYTGLLRLYLKDAFGIDIRSYSSFNCKVHMYFTYTTMQVSSYILVAVTFYRFTVMFNRTIFCKQKKISQANQAKKASSSVYIITAIIVIISGIANLHFLIYYDVFRGQTQKNQFLNDCTINKTSHVTYYWFRTRIYTKLHLYLSIVVPCCILFILNLLIIRKIMVSTKSNSRLKSSSLTSQKKSDKRKNLSIMLVSVCLWFMLLKTPASVFLTLPVQIMNEPHFPFTYSVFMMINYTNHAVNLILYIATSSVFRNEFKEFFLGAKLKVFKIFNINKNINNDEANQTDILNNNNNDIQYDKNNEIVKLNNLSS